MFHNALATFSSLVGSLLSDVTGGFVGAAQNRAIGTGGISGIFEKVGQNSSDAIRISEGAIEI